MDNNINYIHQQIIELFSLHNIVFEKNIGSYGVVYYSFTFSRELASIFESLTGLSASRMLQQHAFQQFCSFIRTEQMPESFIKITSQTITIDVCFCLSLVLCNSGEWTSCRYDVPTSFDEIYLTELEMISLHPSIKSFNDLVTCNNTDIYSLFAERMRKINLNMYTESQFIEDFNLNIQYGTLHPVPSNCLNKLISTIFSVSDRHLMNQIILLTNFSSQLIMRQQEGIFIGFNFEHDSLNKILISNNYFIHPIYTFIFKDFYTSKYYHSHYPLELSILEGSDMFRLTYPLPNGDLYFNLFKSLDCVYNHLLELFRQDILDTLNISIEDFKQQHFDLYHMSII